MFLIFSLVVFPIAGMWWSPFWDSNQLTQLLALPSSKSQFTYKHLEDILNKDKCLNPHYILSTHTNSALPLISDLTYLPFLMHFRSNRTDPMTNSMVTGFHRKNTFNKKCLSTSDIVKSLVLDRSSLGGVCGFVIRPRISCHPPWLHEDWSLR